MGPLRDMIDLTICGCRGRESHAESMKVAMNTTATMVNDSFGERRMPHFLL